MLSRLQRLVAAAHNAFQNFEHYRVIEAFQEFDDAVLELVSAPLAPPFLEKRQSKPIRRSTPC